MTLKKVFWCLAISGFAACSANQENAEKLAQDAICTVCRFDGIRNKIYMNTGDASYYNDGTSNGHEAVRITIPATGSETEPEVFVFAKHYSNKATICDTSNASWHVSHAPSTTNGGIVYVGPGSSGSGYYGSRLKVEKCGSTTNLGASYLAVTGNKILNKYDTNNPNAYLQFDTTAPESQVGSTDDAWYKINVIDNSGTNLGALCTSNYHGRSGQVMFMPGLVNQTLAGTAPNQYYGTFDGYERITYNEVGAASVIHENAQLTLACSTPPTDCLIGENGKTATRPALLSASPTLAYTTSAGEAVYTEDLNFENNCIIPGCNSSSKNNYETGTDCGNTGAAGSNLSNRCTRKCEIVTTGTNCALDSDCKSEHCDSNTSRCAAGAAGAPCASNSDCVSNSCASGQCAKGHNYDTCYSNSDCWSQICANDQCQPGEPGASCSGGNDCYSNSCTSNLCDMGALDTPCIANGNCTSDYCYDDDFDGIGVCKLDNLVTCTSNSQCASNHCTQTYSTVDGFTLTSNKVCTAATCHDGSTNSPETDQIDMGGGVLIDCGGNSDSGCINCPNGKYVIPYFQPSCASGSSSNGYCRHPLCSNATYPYTATDAPWDKAVNSNGVGFNNSTGSYGEDYSDCDNQDPGGNTGSSPPRAGAINTDDFACGWCANHANFQATKYHGQCHAGASEVLPSTTPKTWDCY